MSERTHARGLTRRAMATPVTLVAIGLLVALSLLGGRASRATAQNDASPMASPTTGDCVAGEGTGSALEGGAAVASPMATPAGVAPEATPVDEQSTREAAEAAAENLMVCYNAGDLAAVASLVTANLLQGKFGFGSLEEAAAGLSGMELAPFGLIEFGDVASYADGRVSIELTYMVGQYQYVEARWYMVMEGDALLIDEEELLLPQPDVESLTALSFAITDDTTPLAITSARSVPAPEALVVHGRNLGAEQHIVTMYRVPDEAAATPVAAAEELPADAEFVGQLALGPAPQPGVATEGFEADMALLGLTEGTYVLVDPAVEGSVATLTLTEPVSLEVPVASPAASPAS